MRRQFQKGSGDRNYMKELKLIVLKWRRQNTNPNKVKVTQSVSDSLWPHGLYKYSPWNSPGKDTGMGSHSLLQGIFPIPGLNPGLPHCRQILYQLSHQGSPRILEWVAYPFSSGSSQPRNQTGVSCTVGGYFTSWDIREALILTSLALKEKRAEKWIQVIKRAKSDVSSTIDKGFKIWSLFFH